LANIIPTNISLNELQTNTLLKVESRAVATYRAKMAIRGNSLLSSIFIKSMDPGSSVKVNFYDTTSGNEQDSERFDLNGHDLISAPQSALTDRILVTKIHNKPQVEVIVSGGIVEFGLYVTVVSTTTSLLDDALVREGDTIDLGTDRGVPFACKNTTTGL